MEAAAQTTAQLPTGVYIALGVLVVGNLSTIILLLKMLFQAGMFVKETQMGIADAKSTAVRAHKRIDKVTGDADGE